MKTEVMKHEQFGEVRTVVLDEQNWFVAKDVAITLGYKKPEAAVKKHVAHENKKLVPIRALHSYHVASTVSLNPTGLAQLCDAAYQAHAQDIKHWLLSSVGNNAEKPANNALQLFNDAEFGQIRWKIIDGVIWFVAADMCRILGLADVTSALRNLDDDEKMRINENGVTVGSALGADSVMTPFSRKIDENGVTVDRRYNSAFLHEINVVNEFGLYRLIMASRKPAAKKFQRKIYHEILPSIRKYGYYSVKGEEPAKKVKRRPTPELAVVYAVLLSNMLVKIGMTRDLTARLKDLQKETTADILAWAASAVMTRDEAALLERSLKVKFFDRLVTGEFFNVDFDTAKAALVAPDDKFNKLFALANLLPDSDEKTRLVLQAANLLK